MLSKPVLGAMHYLYDAILLSNEAVLIVFTAFRPESNMLKVLSKMLQEFQKSFTMQLCFFSIPIMLQ